ncbi:ABC transporter ATP-binding protein [Allorhizocola rhizosphaerae]|uniref:ABC transporter ATP-binding protein n=1 Tax=Allorhizocola rhizosphaerae TaxID=1872709 RepID=UPI000E3E1557|nr:ABC transporter ATP-binding protein [Allorhizocola rhizosphaerae]
MLHVEGLSKVYDGHGRRTEAIADITFSVAEFEFACVVGPSGCGKTTLLRCIAGLLAPTSGRITVSGEPVAVVFQEYGRSLFPWMRVRDNVELPLRASHMKAQRRRELVAEALESVGLSDVHNAYPWQLSGGMQQRVAIARAIAYGPRVLLMDEPFAAVDAQTRAELEDLIRSVWQRLGVTLLFITHDIDESVYLGQRVIVLSASPTRVAEIVTVDLPAERDQLTTRSDARFAELRTQVYAQIQKAKRSTP